MDGRTTDGRMDAGLMGILKAHLVSHWLRLAKKRNNAKLCVKCLSKGIIMREKRNNAFQKA